MCNRCVPVLLVLTVAILLAGPAAWGETYTSPAGTIRPGVNYFSLPALPGDGSPTGLDPAIIFAGIPINGKLAYWCRMSQSWHVYPTDMSLVYWHMAHRLEADAEYTITFQGTQPATRQNTCLNPLAACLAFISQPYQFEAYWAEFTFSSNKFPGVQFSTAEAVAKGWIEPFLIEGAADSGVRITLDGSNDTARTVKPWHGYWVTSKVGPEEHELVIYWPMKPILLGDFDRDADVDQDDLVRFQACETGPAILLADPSCREADFDSDGDVDQEDFGIFQRCYGGPDHTPDSNCRN